MDNIRRIFREQSEGERVVIDAPFDPLSWRSGFQQDSLWTTSRLFEISLPSRDVGVCWPVLLSTRDESSVILLMIHNTSWRDKKSSWFLEAHKAPQTVIFSAESLVHDVFRQWIGGMIKDYGFSADDNVINRLYSYHENYALGIFQALERLLLIFGEGHQLTVEDIDADAISQGQYCVDDCVYAIFSQDKIRFVQIIDALQRTDPTIMALLCWRLSHDLRLCAECRQEHEKTHAPLSDILQKKKIFGVRKSYFLKALKHIHQENMIRALLQLSHIDQKNKGREEGSPWSSFFYLGLSLIQGDNLFTNV